MATRVSCDGVEYFLLSCFAVEYRLYPRQFFIITKFLLVSPDNFVALGLNFEEEEERVVHLRGEGKKQLTELKALPRVPWRDLLEKHVFEWHPEVIFLKPILSPPSEPFLASSWLFTEAGEDASCFERQEPEERMLFYGHQWRQKLSFSVGLSPSFDQLSTHSFLFPFFFFPDFEDRRSNFYFHATRSCHQTL
jgi:hypothetical protein